MKSKPPQRDEEREERIMMEIVVDCYNESEAWTGWHCYLEDRLSFPFQAECVRSRRSSLLNPGERVTVIGMSDDDGMLGEMEVLIQWQDRECGVPLADITGIDVDETTAQAIADWHYRVEQGYRF